MVMGSVWAQTNWQTDVQAKIETTTTCARHMDLKFKISDNIHFDPYFTINSGYRNFF